MGEIKQRHQIRIKEDEVRKVWGEVNPTSMDDLHKVSYDLDEEAYGVWIWSKVEIQVTYEFYN